MLPGIGGVMPSIAAAAREFSYLGSFADDSGISSSQNIPNVDFGGAVTGRRLFHSIHWQEGGTHANLTSVTVGGTSATIHSQGGHSGGGTGFGVALVSVAKDADASGAVVCNFDGLVNSASCTSIRAVGLADSSPFDTAQDSSSGTSTSLSTTIDVPENGLTIAAFTGSTLADKTGTWSGVDEEFDNGTNGSSLAWDHDMAEQSGRTVSFTVTTETNSGNHMLVLSWA